MPRLAAFVFALLTLAVTVAAAARPAPAMGTDPASVVGSGTIEWASVAVRALPTRASSTLVTLRQFRSDFRPQIVLAIAARNGADGEPAWYRITVPGRPNGRTGWVPAASVSLKPVDRYLAVHRSTRRFEFWMRGRVVRKGIVAVGARGAETPTGLFYVTWKFDPSAPILGAYAFETSAYSKLSDWPGGGIVGVHGTSNPELLGQAVSHGCVRLHNRDALFLRPLMRLGTPISIQA
jgi:lipoprotein-anchoring transpeptidase ErfK/SrfK